MGSLALLYSNLLCIIRGQWSFKTVHIYVHVIDAHTLVPNISSITEMREVDILSGMRNRNAKIIENESKGNGCAVLWRVYTHAHVSMMTGEKVSRIFQKSSRVTRKAKTESRMNSLDMKSFTPNQWRGCKLIEPAPHDEITDTSVFKGPSRPHGTVMEGPFLSIFLKDSSSRCSKESPT